MSKSQSDRNKKMFSLTPDAIIDLYEIDFSNLQMNFDELRDLYGINLGADTVYRFCPMINGTNPIVWQGKSFQPLPIEVEGFEQTGGGKLARPKLKVANPEGIFSKIVHSNEDFAKCKVTRKRVFAGFLDEENFQNRNLNSSGGNPFGISDQQAGFSDDVFFINSKTFESNEAIEFELVSVLELEKAYVPGRVILSGYCNWQYRCSIGCRYAGLPIESETGLDLTKQFQPNIKRKTGKLDENLEAFSVDPSLYPGGERSVPEWSRYGKNGSEDNQLGYNAGDVVKIINKKSSNPYRSTPSLFVCIKSHDDASVAHPFFFKTYWAKDECSKSLQSCKKRFSKSSDFLDFNNANNSPGLPFGGFPGTERFPIE